MEPAFWGTELHHFPICTKSKFKLRNHLKKKHTKKETNSLFHWGKVQPLLLSESSNNRVPWGLPAQADFPHKCITPDGFGQIWNVPFFLQKRFSTLGLPKPRVQSFTTTFFCGSKLTTTLLEKDVSQYVWLFVSLWCSLERKDGKERKAGKERLTSFASFPWGVFAYKIITPNQSIIEIYIKYFQVLKQEQSPLCPCEVSFCFSHYTNR